MSGQPNVFARRENGADGARSSAPASSVERQHAPTVGDDEILRLVQRIFLLPGDGKAPGAVEFCGANPGVGCSWVCAKAGEALAQQAVGSVCLVDANLRDPSIHLKFHVEQAPGFAELVRTSSPVTDFMHTTGTENLWVVAAGSAAKSANGSLNSRRLPTRLAELRAEFDFVLIDTPAIDSAADALLLGRFTDGAVLVVDSNSTRREMARSARAAFDTAEVPMLGAVLNRRTYPIPSAIYRNL